MKPLEVCEKHYIYDFLVSIYVSPYILTDEQTKLHEARGKILSLLTKTTNKIQKIKLDNYLKTVNQRLIDISVKEDYKMMYL